MTSSRPGGRWRMFAVASVVLTFAAQGTAVATTSSAHSRVTASSARATAAAEQGRITAGDHRWVRVEDQCGTVVAGRYSCLAKRLVPSYRGAVGAREVVKPGYSVGPAGGFTPADLASAYGYTASAATTQTVAVVDAYDDPKALANLSAFDAHYGLPTETTTSFRKVNQTGATSPLPAADADWAGEIALDIETVRSVCNHCKIILVEANSPTSANLAAGVNEAVKLGAKEVTNSYGGPETSGNTASVVAAYNHPGVVITASTGDDGWYGWDYANEGSGRSDNAPESPASLPTVVAVAGTALALNSNGTRRAEDVWNEDGLDDEEYGVSAGASGGGCSTRYQAQSWQSGVAGYSKTGCGTKRMTGDIAALADPYTGFDVYDTYQAGGWETFGGTSLASPIIAAMWALAGGSGGVAYPSQSLYKNLKAHPTSVFDVTIGGNSFCGGDTPSHCSAVLRSETSPPTGNPNQLADPNGAASGWQDCSFAASGTATVANNSQCNAKAGYDGASGVGTPKGLTVFKPA